MHDADEEVEQVERGHAALAVHFAGERLVAGSDCGEHLVDLRAKVLGGLNSKCHM